MLADTIKASAQGAASKSGGIIYLRQGGGYRERHTETNKGERKAHTLVLLLLPLTLTHTLPGPSL